MALSSKECHLATPHHKLKEIQMKSLIFGFSLAFLLATIYTIAPAAVVPGALLYLDAADNPDYPDAWKNLGDAGGELSSAGKPPEKDKGTIKIDSLGINEADSQFYTFKESGQAFGAAGDKVVLAVSDWTIEVLCRRNGGALGPEHHLAGFQNLPVEGKQGIRLNLWEGPDDLTFSIHAKGGKVGVQPLKVKLEQDVWNWVALVHTSKKSLVAYQNGEEISQQAGWDFDKGTPLNMVMIGANSYGERPRTFNGSVAIVRVYDKALSEAQINQNIAETFDVQPADKLATTWGKVKKEY
jgi:hypothetical protein